VQVPCSNGAAARWAYDAATGRLAWGADASLCLDAGSTVPGCAAGGGAPFCNATLPVGARVALLLAAMLPVEKAAMLSASNNGVPRLGVPPLRYGVTASSRTGAAGSADASKLGGLCGSPRRDAARDPKNKPHMEQERSRGKPT
jgi:hypothetical protein